LNINQGVVVAPVKGGPADKAGIKEYDIITKVQGQKIGTGQELQEKVFACRIGEVIKVILPAYPAMVRVKRKQGTAGKTRKRRVYKCFKR
jgi:serine protease Do